MRSLLGRYSTCQPPYRHKRPFWLLFSLLVYISGTRAFSPTQSSIITCRAQKEWGGFDQDAFDFSSSANWETFYQQEQTIVEWHSSVPLKTISEIIPPSATSCLVIGCGNSHLPSVIRATRPNCCITLLDSSPTCMAALQIRYQQDASFSFLCGDALALEEVIRDQADSKHFDVVLDKGLMDAFLCGDDWDRTIVPLLEQVSRILWNGSYILVSYKLPRSTRQFLTDVGHRVGLAWEFDIVGSNDRVGISLATKLDLNE